MEKKVTLRELVDLQRQTLELLRQTLELLQKVAQPPIFIRPIEPVPLTSPNTMPYPQPVIQPLPTVPITPGWPNGTIICANNTNELTEKMVSSGMGVKACFSE